MPAPRMSTGSIPTTSKQRYRSSAAWSPNDDAQLLSARAKGMTWAAISQQYFPSKGDNACRKHHERLVKRQNNESWDQEMLQTFAAAYWNRRKDIWSPLADAMNQKWQFVEEKCMELGLARLRSAAAEANKNRRRISGTDDDDLSDDEADSGIAMEDETEMENIGRRHTTGPPSIMSGSGRGVSSGGGDGGSGRQVFRQTGPPIQTALTPPQQTAPFRYEPAPSHSYPGVQAFSPSDPSRTLPHPATTRPPSRPRSERHSIQSLLSPIPDS